MDHLGIPFYQEYVEGTGQSKAKAADLLLGLGFSSGHHAVPEESYKWYINMRQVIPLLTSGLGMGTERYLCWLLQHDDIKEVNALISSDFQVPGHQKDLNITDGTRKGCPSCTGATSRGKGQPPQHQLPPERQRRPAEERGGSAATATGNRLSLASPGSSLEQPRPAAPLPGDQEPKAPCSRRRWEGSCLVALLTDSSRPSEKLPPRPNCRASSGTHPASSCNQLAPRHLHQLEQQPQASGLRDGGGGHRQIVLRGTVFLDLHLQPACFTPSSLRHPTLLPAPCLTPGYTK
ncbi:hypothetical protein N1851_024681 [Merluccius polli]|uniref:Uncharacterized protein n=1 Tax=Merluccius polli TaxID=89951 RepID=A0AA47MEJ6_MERPO|nr:hypothetical protein N1851_024681 [Merluccius polli]